SYHSEKTKSCHYAPPPFRFRSNASAAKIQVKKKQWYHYPTSPGETPDDQSLPIQSPFCSSTNISREKYFSIVHAEWLQKRDPVTIETAEEQSSSKEHRPSPSHILFHDHQNSKPQQSFVPSTDSSPIKSIR